MTRTQFISQVQSTQREFRRFLTALCCGDTSLADDIAQEAYLKAYLNSDHFKDESKFRAWIFRIGYNVFIDHRRSARRYESMDNAAAVLSTDSADAAFRYQGLYAAMSQLSARERTAVLLYYMEGYDVREISGIIEASEDAVKQQLSRGRKHLKGLLDKQ